MQQILFIHFSDQETAELVSLLREARHMPQFSTISSRDEWEGGLCWPWDIVAFRLTADSPPLGDFLRMWERCVQKPRLIILADEASVRQAVTAMQSGATDFLLWEERKEFAASFDRALRQSRADNDALCSDKFVEFAHFSIERTGEAVFWADALGRIFYANQAALDLTGHTRAALHRMLLHDLAPGESRDGWGAMLRDLRTQRSLLLETTLLTMRGEMVPIEVVLGHMEIDGQEIVTVFARDITERRRMEEALSTEGRRYRSLFEDCPISLWEEDLSGVQDFFNELKARGVTDFDAHFRDCPDDLFQCVLRVKVLNVNKATVKMLEAESKEQLLAGLDKVFTEDSLRVAREEFRDLAHGKFHYSGELEHRTMRGRTIRVAVHFNVAPEYRHSLGRVVVSLIDVTDVRNMQRELEAARCDLERRVEERTVALTDANANLRHEIAEREEVERRLRRNEQRLRMLVDSLPVVIHAHDEDGNYVFWNRECERRLGYTAQEALGASDIRERLYPDPGQRARIEQVHSSGDFNEIELETTAKNGEQRIIRWTNMAARSPIPGWGLWEAGIDLTDERIAESRVHSLTHELFRAQENERRRIALELHDNVAQNLSSLKIGCKTLFDDETVVSPTLRERSQTLAELLDSCINSVRDMSYDLLPPGLEQLGLARALDQFCREFSHVTGVPVELTLAGMERLRLGYDVEINLYRLVQEAVRNAVRHGAPSLVEVKLVASSPNVILRVEDNGCGFDVEARKAQVHDERRMGLRTMEERAKLLDGEFHISSVVDKGTRIFVQIPYGESAA